MDDKVDNENSAPKKTGGSGIDKIIFATLIAGAAAVLIYQMFFCATCYA